jgi:CxxC motif-containing protein (DUF1111 family)
MAPRPSIYLCGEEPDMNSKNPYCLGVFVPLALVFAWFAAPAGADPWSDKQKESLAAGKELFTREWLHGDKRSHAGDGLGPVFNARSCAACHNQGGVGGAGPKQNNATIVSAFVQLDRGPVTISGVAVHTQPDPKKPIKQPSREKLAEIHPALRTEGSFPLHRFSTEKESTKWKLQALGIPESDRLPAESVIEVELRANMRFLEGSWKIDGVDIVLIPSQRNTPALFGTGLIDRIPDRVFEEVAAEQQRAADEASKRERTETPSGSPASLVHPGEVEVALPVAGRVARLKNGRIGRFGWKAQVSGLREFTLQACSNELGLEVPGFHRAAPPWKKDYKAPGLDLTDEQCNQLIRFVASLPAPGTRTPETPQHAAEITAGQKLFARVGCVACHRPKLGDVDGIYSDLLLHDMGQRLSDTGFYGTTNPEVASKEEVNPLPVNGLGGEPSKTKPKPPRFGAAAREWRTPPLWGLRDSGPYLHDGRADTVEDAVAAHGGEGLVAAQAFFQLTPRERQQVELFLQSLTAPKVLP